MSYLSPESASRRLYVQGQGAPLAGSHAAIDSVIEHLEATHVSLSFGEGWSGESTIPTAYQQPLDPHAVEHVDFRSKDKRISDYRSKIIPALWSSGVHTYGDMAALGLERIASETHLTLPQIELVGKVFESATGETLPVSRPPLLELASYFNDLRHASPAVLLPMAGAVDFLFRSYQDMFLDGRHMTLGKMLVRYVRDEDTLLDMTLKKSTDWRQQYQHHMNLVRFTQDRARPIIENFDEHIRKPRLEAKHKRLTADIQNAKK